MSDEIKYPEQVFVIKRKDKTFGIDAKLAVPDTKKGNSPLELHAGYSRFVLSILPQKNGKFDTKDVVTANLSPEILPVIKRYTDIAIEKIFEKSLQKGKPAVSAAYTTTFFSGTFKGKTPASVLLENPANEKELLAHKAFLEANIARFPGNKSQIDAIDEAIKLKQEGQLDASSSTAQVFDIYRADIRMPHASVKDSEGLTDVYSLSIVCDISKEYPFIINISNCKAPPIGAEGGMQHPEMKKAKYLKEANIMLTTSEWYTGITKLERIKNLFEETNFPELYKIAKDNSFHNT